MPTVRYTGGGRYRIAGQNFGPGDTREVDEDIAEHLRGVDEFDVLDESGDSDEEGEETDESDVNEVAGESGTLPFNPEAKTNDDIADRVADIDDPETLQALLNLEEEQQDRTGATDAIEDRLDELEG